MANAFDRARQQLPGGGELTIAAMDEYQYHEIGRKTYDFVRSVMRNPELRKIIQERAAQLRNSEAAQLSGI